MIPQDFIQTVLDRTDIVEVVRRYVPLKKAGQNFSACCPFHQEKSPSFSVSPSKQFYHCFGCGAHGNALTFIMEHTGAPFVEAVKQLAQQAGLEVPQSEIKIPSERHFLENRQNEAAYNLLTAVASFYMEKLHQFKHAQTYIQERGISQDIIDAFKIGYAPNQPNQSVSQQFHTEHTLLQEQGLSLISEKTNKPYDRFRDRIIFPIHDTQGRCVGFGGRSLQNEQTPKYLNSPETSLFNKSHLLYGLHLARMHFKVGHALIVEGYMDVITLHQYGFKNSVATLGTAINTEHLKKLFRYTDTLIFCFDGDQAGQKAAQKALDHGLSVIQDGQTIKFLFLPDNHDPDSFLKQHGKEGFQQQIAQGKPLSEVWVSRWLDQHPPTHAEARAALWKGAKQELNTLTQAPLLAKFLREDLYHRVSTFNRPSHNKIAHATSQKPPFQPFTKGKTKAHEFNPTEMSLSLPRPRPSLWRTALDLALFAPSIRDKIPTPDQHIPDQDAQALLALLAIAPALEKIEHIKDHIQLKKHMLALESSINRIALWDNQFDIQAELNGLIQTVKQAKEKQARLAHYNKFN